MKLYAKYFSMHIKSQMQYKLSFFFTCTGQFLVAFATFLSIHFLFARFDSVGGFTYEEVLICFAVMIMAFSLSELIGRGFDRFPILLGNGGFDRIMVRPRNVVFQVLASQVEFSRLGRFIQAVVVLAFALPRSGIDWTWDKILTLIFMIVCGAFLFFGLFVIYAAFTFFTLEGLEFMNILTDGGREHGRLPFSVYGDGVLKFLTYVVPLALVQYYPLLYLTGRTEDMRYMFVPILALLFLIPCRAFFKLGMRKYKSTGS
ncbi:MAG: ABC-2 family transporter protein [Defluviitaleaceae bacterium]|nr:ABC-2 family transporter protein [Defluviitaleaceae bacterium]MCL2273341.1 ABC-2 family transporter protein [Defluviitaleaceae bacterium]